MSRVAMMIKYLRATIALFLACIAAAMAQAQLAYAAEIQAESEATPAAITAVVEQEDTQVAEAAQVAKAEADAVSDTASQSVAEAVAEAAPASAATSADSAAASEPAVSPEDQAVAESSAACASEAAPVQAAASVAEPAAKSAATAAEQAAESAATAPADEATSTEAASTTKAAATEAASATQNNASVAATRSLSVQTASAKTTRMAASVPAVSSQAAETTHTIGTNGGVYSITQAGTYRITGSGNESISIAQKIQGAVNVIFENATIDASGTGHSAVSVVNGAEAVLTIVGNCLFTGDVNRAGIEVSGDSTVTIEGADEASTLTAIGNAGVDYSSVAEGNAAGNTHGSGIGGTAASPNSGTIVINGHERNLTVSAIGGGKGASGIGADHGGSSAGITINETNLVGVHGGCQNASNEGDATYAKKALEGGAAIGGGAKTGSGGTIVISDSYGRDIVGGSKAAGIGGGCWATNTSIRIENGSDLEVWGGLTGAGVGVGRANTNMNLNIAIDDSFVKAQGGNLGAGIGLGLNGSNYALDVTHVTISGNSVVNAVGGTGAAGIGGGARGYNVAVSILDNAQVTAVAGGAYVPKSYAQAYNGNAMNADNVDGTETKGLGQSGAAAIGRGAWGSMNFYDGWTSSGSWKGPKGSTETALVESSSNPELKIGENAMVTAISSGDNWAIAGFTNINDTVEGNATMAMLRFVRNYDLKSSGKDAGYLSRAWDAESNREVFIIDGKEATSINVYRVVDDSLEYVTTIELPAADESFGEGYTGSGRLGYYSFAITLPDGAGEYRFSTESDLRNMEDETVTSSEEGYVGGLSYRAGDERTEVFATTGGKVNAFDYGAFRAAGEDMLRYVANGGSGTMSNSVGTWKGSVSVKANAFTREGWTFVGWNTAADGTGVTYDADAMYALTDADDVLYALWAEASDDRADDPTGPEGIVTPDDSADPEDVVSPDDPADPDSSLDPQDTPVVPEGADEPVAPEDSTDLDDGAYSDESADEPVSPAEGDDVTEATSEIADSDTPLAAAVAQVAPLVAPAALAVPVAAATPIQDDANPLVVGTDVIADEETPMAAGHQHGPSCWVHWWILLGIIITTIYSCVVVARRSNNSRKLQKMDNRAMGQDVPDEPEPEPAPTSTPQLA